MKYFFHPDAEFELNASVDCYEACQVNLGSEFVCEVQKTIQRVLAFPEAWPRLDGCIRRCLVNRFPFGVIYYQRGSDIHYISRYAIKQRAKLLEASRVASITVSLF